MIQQFFIYLISFIALAFFGYYIHTSVLHSIAEVSPVSLLNLYLFFTSFSLILCISFLYSQKTERFKDQLGFLYLLSVVLKIVVFCVVFRGAIFSQDSFTNKQTVNLLIPIFLMIVLEVFFISKMLNKNKPIKND